MLYMGSVTHNDHCNSHPFISDIRAIMHDHRTKKKLFVPGAGLPPCFGGGSCPWSTLEKSWRASEGLRTNFIVRSSNTFWWEARLRISSNQVPPSQVVALVWADKVSACRCLLLSSSLRLLSQRSSTHSSSLALVNNNSNPASRISPNNSRSRSNSNSNSKHSNNSSSNPSSNSNNLLHSSSNLLQDSSNSLNRDSSSSTNNKHSKQGTL